MLGRAESFSAATATLRMTFTDKNCGQLRTHNFWIISCLNWTQVLSKATRAVAVAAEKDPARRNRTRRA